MSVDGKVDLHVRLRLRLAAARFVDRFGEQPHVQVEADRCDVPGLLGAEQVACAADLEVAKRDLQAAPQIGELTDRVQARVRLLGERAVGRVQEVRVRALVRAADAPAQLVQLRETERVRAVDDQRVRRRDVEARLDDRRGHQDVVLAVPEVEHRLLEPPLLHLSVHDAHARFGYQLPDASRDDVDVLHLVMDVERLPFTQHLATDRARLRLLARLADERQHRMPVLRRRVDNAHVADATHRHLERARDRRRRHRQDVHRRLQLLEAFLVRDAEALLFIHDEQPEVGEDDILLEQPVGADDDVDLAGGNLFEHARLLFRGDEAAEHDDAHGERRVPLGERGVVLLCEQRRRDEHRDLLPVEHRLEGRSDRDLGLAETDVAADQPVHRDRLLHVRLDVVDRGELILRFDVRERVFQLALPRLVGREGEAFRRRARGVQLDELAGHIAHRLAHFGLLAVPVAGAEAVELRSFAADVLRHRVDLIGGNEELVPLSVFEREVVVDRSGDLTRFHPAVTADTVHDVDDEVALDQIERRNGAA